MSDTDLTVPSAAESLVFVSGCMETVMVHGFSVFLYRYIGFLKTCHVLPVICPHKNTCFHNFPDLVSSPGKYKVRIRTVIYKIPYVLVPFGQTILTRVMMVHLTA